MGIKKEFRFFTIMEYEKEQIYLQEQHKNGWKFIKVTGIGTYHFEKDEPVDVIYQLDYNQEGIAHKEEYVQMFKDCGWEYLMDFYGYSYFRKPVSKMNGKEEIFCDDSSRLEMMKRIFKGRMNPLLILFCVVIIPQIILCLTFYQSYVLGVLYTGILAIYVIIFAHYSIKYNQYKKKIGN